MWTDKGPHPAYQGLRAADGSRAALPFIPALPQRPEVALPAAPVHYSDPIPARDVGFRAPFLPGCVAQCWAPSCHPAPGDRVSGLEAGNVCGVCLPLLVP